MELGQEAFAAWREAVVQVKVAQSLCGEGDVVAGDEHGQAHRSEMAINTHTPENWAWFKKGADFFD